MTQNASASRTRAVTIGRNWFALSAMFLGPKSIRVAVVAPVRLYREGLANALARRPGFEVPYAQADWRDGFAHLGAQAPDVVLLDMTLAERHDLAGELRHHPRKIPIVGVGSGDSEQEIIACAEVGTAAYLTRDASLDELAEVIQWAARPDSAGTPKFGKALVRWDAHAVSTRPHSLRGLTRREREIGYLLERDLTNKQIAVRLGIEVATVKNHVHNLLEKLKVHRRIEAARLLGRARRDVPRSGRGAKS